MSADELFCAKIQTGKYNHYDLEALMILYDDCVRQANLMKEFC